MRWFLIQVFVFCNLIFSNMSVLGADSNHPGINHYRVYGQKHTTMNNKNQTYENYQFHMVDTQNGKEFVVSLYMKNGQCIGSPILEKDYSNFSDINARVSYRQVNDNTSKDILNELQANFEELKIRGPSRQIKLDSPDLAADQNKKTPKNKIIDFGLTQFSRSGFSNSNTDIGIGDAQLKAELQAQKYAGMVENFERAKWSAEAHMAQQKAIGDAINKYRASAQNALNQNIDEVTAADGMTKADTLFVMYQLVQQLNSKPGLISELPNENEIEVNTEVNLTPEVANVFKQTLLLAIDEKNWQLAGELAAKLYNPWNHNRPDADTQKFIDEQGILKGPGLKLNSVQITKLADSNPKLAYALLRVANQVQATALQKPFMAVIGKTRVVLESANLLMSLTTHTGESKHLAGATSIANYFLGKPSTLSIVQDSHGVIHFAAGTELDNIINQSGGEGNLAKAVYHEIANNLDWVSDKNSQVTITRNGQQFIDLNASLNNFVSTTLQSSQWLNRAQQKYSLQLPGYTFTRVDFNSVYSQMAAQKNVNFPLQAQAAEGSFNALVLSELLHETKTELGRVDWATIGLQVADVGLGFIPYVNTAKDAYELVTGYHLITGKKLTTDERVFAAVGVITFGIGSKVGGAFEAMQEAKKITKLGEDIQSVVKFTENLPVEELEKTLVHSVSKLETLKNESNVLGKHTSEIANQQYREPAYWQGLGENHLIDVLSAETKSATMLARVSNEGNQTGRWFLKAEDIENLSPLQIKDKFNLPNAPTIIEHWEIPSGEKMFIGVVGPNAFGNSVGAIQYELKRPLSEIEALRVDWKKFDKLLID